MIGIMSKSNLGYCSASIPLAKDSNKETIIKIILQTSIVLYK